MFLLELYPWLQEGFALYYYKQLISFTIIKHLKFTDLHDILQYVIINVSCEHVVHSQAGLAIIGDTICTDSSVNQGHDVYNLVEPELLL